MSRLDAQVVKAMLYLKAMIDAGKHAPSAEARRAVRGVQESIDTLERSEAQAWH